MTLSVDIASSRGSFSIAARFASSGRLTALFGPSGSGKTSLVNLIGGLTKPERGRIAIGDTVLVDTQAGIFIPKHRRRIGYVFQDARLFSHMTVSQNLRYGRWFTPASERYADMDRIVALLGIGALLDRRPSSLSGGEKQRVAIGRALIASPRLILMDEPLASLDGARKSEVMPYIERLRDELAIPIVYVSHSVAEVARLASDIVVLADGKVRAAGAASDILQRLDMLPEEERGEGGSILDMRVAASPDAFDTTILRSAAGDLLVTGNVAPPGASVRVRIRARDVMIAVERPNGLSALNILPAIVSSITEPNGAVCDVLLDWNGQIIAARITARSCHDLGLVPGKSVFAIIKSVSMDQTQASQPQ